MQLRTICSNFQKGDIAMKTGFFKKHKKALIITLVSLCAIACTAGGVFAYLVASTDTLSNIFVPAKVTCEIRETFENGVKENVCVKNTGNVDAFIRAAVVVTFEADDGKVLATAPVEGVDYTVDWNTYDWAPGSDGYWYHKKPVSPEELTAELIRTATAISAPDGYRLNIRIIATAVQSNPENAVKDAWGISLTDGELIPG